MQSHHRILLRVFVLAGIAMSHTAVAQPPNAVAEYLRSEIEAGHVVGAQVLISSLRSRPGETIALGHIDPDKSRPVTSQTVFCVGSCSKPIASALIFTLLDRKQLRLDQRASDFIPQMTSLEVAPLRCLRAVLFAIAAELYKGLNPYFARSCIEFFPTKP